MSRSVRWMQAAGLWLMALCLLMTCAIDASANNPGRRAKKVLKRPEYQTELPQRRRGSGLQLPLKGGGALSCSAYVSINWSISSRVAAGPNRTPCVCPGR